MKTTHVEPPREFSVGPPPQITLKDCARIHLEPDEQVTFTTENEAEYDLTRKDWGFYATPSLNGRLPSFGLRPLLVKNQDTGRRFVMLVETTKEDLFEQYVRKENLLVVARLDDEEQLHLIEKALPPQ